MTDDMQASRVPVDFDPFADGELTTWAPSTQAQMEIWSAAQLSPEASLANNESISLICRGHFDGPRMEEALDRLWRRHEALRASFSADGQQISFAEPRSLPVRHLDLADRPALLKEVLWSEVTSPFDLQRGPLFRATIVRLAPDLHQVILSAHHIVCDGWSFGVLIQDLAILFNAAVEGRAAELPPAGRFSEFALAEQQASADPADERYWLDRFAAPLPVVDLPTDRPRPRMRTIRSERAEIDLPGELVAKLRKAGSSIGGASLFTTLLAGFSSLVHRLTGEREMAIGVPAAGQMASGHEGLVGHCSNILPIRVEVSREQRFIDLLKAHRRHVLDAYDHQRHSLGSLLSKLRIPRDPSRVPLVPLLFNLDAGLETPRGPRFAGLDVDVAGNPRAYDSFELSMNCMETRRGLRLQWNYNPDLWDAATARQRVAGYAALLEAVAEDPTRRVGDLPLLAPDDQRTLAAWSSAPAEPGSADRVDRIVERCARDNPDAVAISRGDLRISYAELDRRAARLAAALLRAREGSEPGPVGVLLPASPDRVVALLAVLKAGAAWVPLEPSEAPERLAFFLEDSRALLVLTDGRHDGALPADVRVVRVDELEHVPDESDQSPAQLDRAAAGGDEPACILYVAREEGPPVGVRLSHRALLQAARPAGATLVESDDVCLPLAAFGQPESLTELWAPLLVGARLAIPPLLEESAPAWPGTGELARWIRGEGVTSLQVAAPHFHALVDADPAALSPLRRLRITGSPPSPSHLRKARQRLPDVALSTSWGAAECGPLALLGRLDTDDAGLPVPLGRPAGGVSALVLDGDRQVVPPGVPGELHVGGVGLADGYLDGPHVPADRFVSPSPGEAGGRLFRTGLRARWRSDGQLEHLGRIDDTVEVRGYRVLPREVESALEAHPAVHECIVALHEEAPGQGRLAAWVVLEDADTTAAALREHLAQRLPDFLVPSAVVLLPALPRDVSGAIDRARLPRPQGGAAGGGFVAPRTPTEELLAGIWAEVLSLPRVGVHDDFFALGGHSLPWTRMFAALARTFQIELPLGVLFEARTVALLAERVEQAQRSERGAAPRQPLTARPRLGPPPLSFAQERLWLLDQLHPGDNTFNIATATHLDGPLDLPAFERSMAEIVRRHEALRTTFAKVDGEPRQIIRDEALMVRVVDLTDTPEGEREAEARRLAAEEARRPFDLERGPLFRATVLRLSERSHVFITTMHHIVSDGWSHGNMGEELAALYEAFLHGRPSPLAELPLQYADYAIWQREWLASGVADAQIDYWKRQLEGAPPFIELPTVRPRPAVQTHNGAMHQLRLPLERLQALSAHCGRQGLTMFMLLLAAFQALLARYTGLEDIVTGSPIAGRTRAETDRLIGFFLNTLALRTSLAGRPTFRELCNRVRQVTLDAYANQDVPFERLVEALAPPRDLGRTPLFQIYFNMLNLPPPGEALPGITARAWKITDDVAKFDLDLYAEETTTGLDLQLFYNTDLFDGDQTRALLEHFVELLLAAVDDPDRTIDQLPLGRPAVCRPPERTVLGTPGPRFERFSDEATDQSAGRRFAEVAARHGDRIAIRTATEEVSYAALDAHSDHVAAAIGLEPGRVALLFEPGASMVAAMLGALKAGTTYVPLEVASPPERLASLMRDAGARALLAHGPTLAKARGLAPAGLPVLDVDALEPAPPLETSVDPDTPAYILYTSGSTGTPKGVVQSHRGLLRHIRNYVNRLHLSPDDSLSLLASYAFDAAAMDIFGALLCGATLCPIDMRRGGLQELPSVVRQLGVTVYHSTPTVFRHLAGLLRAGEQLAGVRLVVLGGEEAQARDLEAFRRHFSDEALLVNGLGPTESTLALQYFLDNHSTLARETVPVGYPVEEVEVRLVTALGEQAAVWGVGQIELSAPQVALGYWNRPDLTAAAFAPDPARPGARVYRTGDLARLLPGGALEYMGRADHQVKIRGHRIELGEIEARLLEHPAVSRAVVAPREDAQGDRTLAAWLVTAPGRAPSPGELRAHLERSLPAYMLPGAFVFVDAIPLLPNGKVDRRALPAPAAGSVVESSGFAPPRDDLEVVLASIFRQVLGLQTVGLRDSFFDLGGHSMMAVKLVERIERRLGRSLPLVTLFEAQTVEQLAAVLRQGERESERMRFAVRPIRATGRKRPLFLVSRPNVNALGFIALARHLDPDRPVYDIQGDHPDDWELGRPFSRGEYRNWATSYLEAMRLIQPSGPYLIAGMCEGALIAFEMVRMLEAEGDKAAFLGMFDAWPEENTRRPLLNRVWKVHDRLRTMAAQSNDENLRYLKYRVGGLLNHLGLVPADAPPPREASGEKLETWNERMFPGPSFVPPKVKAPITVFRVRKQRYFRIDDHQLGWGNRTVGGVSVHIVPGDHATLLREPHAARLGPIVDAAVRRAEETCAPATTPA